MMALLKTYWVKLSPFVETIVINCFLAAIDAVILVASNGQHLDWALASHAAGNGVATYLTSWWRENRAKLVVGLVASGAPVDVAHAVADAAPITGVVDASPATTPKQ